MRFRALALLAAVLAAPAAHAQLFPSFGVTGGVNFANLSDAVAVELDGATGFHLGVYADLGLGSVGLRPQLLYLRAGEVVTPDFADPQGNPLDASVAANFIAIPVDFQYRLPTPVVKPYALLGPEVRFPIGDTGPDAEAEARSVTAAINVGLGIGFNAPLVGPSGFAELRYAFDLTGLVDGLVINDIALDDEYRVNLLMLRVGVGL